MSDTGDHGFGRPPGGPCVSRAAKVNDDLVIIAAAKSLGKLRNADAIPMLNELLENENSDVSEAARCSLDWLLSDQ